MYILIHPSRTGGTSLARILKNELEIRILRDEPEQLKNPNYQHTPPNQIKNIQSYKPIVSVRDPYVKVFSGYCKNVYKMERFSKTFLEYLRQAEGFLQEYKAKGFDYAQCSHLPCYEFVKDLTNPIIIR